MTVDLRGAGYAAGRNSSTLKGRTKQFGWLQAPATVRLTRHSHAASEKLNSVVRVVQTGPPAPSESTRIKSHLPPSTPRTATPFAWLAEEKVSPLRSCFTSVIVIPRALA